MNKILKFTGQDSMRLWRKAPLIVAAVAWAFTLLNVSATQLSEENQLILREAVEGQDARNRGEAGFIPKIDRGMQLATNLGKASNQDAIPFLFALKDGELLNQFANGFQGPSTPSLEALIIEYRRAPKMWQSVLRLVKKNSSRPLYVALLSDLRLPASSFQYPRDRQHFGLAMLRTELPGVESEILELLPDPLLLLMVAEFLANRNYQPAEPALFELLERMPTSDIRLGKLAEISVKLNSQRMHDVAARKLIELGINRDNLQLESNFRSLREALAYGPSRTRLSPLLLEPRKLLGYTEAQRTDFEAMVSQRIVRQKMAVEMTPDNLGSWICSGDVDIVQSFINAPVDVNALASRGRALHVAVFCSNWTMVKLLLAAGADPRLGDSNGNTPLHVLASQRSFDANNDWKMKQGANIDVLISAGADASAAAIGGTTPLHAAVQAGNRAMVEALIARKANINAEALDTTLQIIGVTPLQLAMDTHNKSLEEFLQSKGAKVSQLLQVRREIDTAKRAVTGRF